MKLDDLIFILEAIRKKNGNVEVKSIDYDGGISEIDHVKYDPESKSVHIVLPEAIYF
jgi:hypothetical protein